MFGREFICVHVVLIGERFYFPHAMHSEFKPVVLICCVRLSVVESLCKGNASPLLITYISQPTRVFLPVYLHRSSLYIIR